MTDTASPPRSGAPDGLAEPGTPRPDAAAAPIRARRNPRHRWLAFAAGFLIVVVGAELATRVVHERLDDPLEYFSGDAQRISQDMKILADRGITSDITFVGTSMVRRDVEANLLEKEMGLDWVHNVALPGARINLLSRWMLEEVEPRLRPERVVWGISSLEFNENSITDVEERYATSRATKRGFFGEVDRLLSNLAISEYRNALRDPVALVHAAKGVGHDFERDRPIGSRAVWEQEFRYKTPAELAKMRSEHLNGLVRPKQLHDFAIGEDGLDAFRDAITELERRGVDVVLAAVPVTTEYIDAHPRADDYAKWLETMRAVAEDLDVPLLDHHSDFPDDDFRDVEHLNIDAADRFTRSMARDLEALPEQSSYDDGTRAP